MDNCCTRVYLLRHGETENFKGIFKFNGQNDVDVTPKGEEQLALQVKCLEEKPIKAVYCSDLIRARKGAETVASALGLEILPDKRLREINAGHWETLSKEEVIARYPGEFEERYNDIVNYRIPGGGENLLDVQSRARDAVTEIISKHRGEDLAIVAHGGINRIIILDAINLGLANLLRIEQDFGCLNIIEYYDETAVLRMLNLRPSAG